MSLLALAAITNPVQDFYKEAVTWKHLSHPNILPLLGITMNPFRLISNWVSGGNLLEYIQGHPGANRLGLVGSPSPRLLRFSDA